jgi:hypothetical protein
MSARTLPLSINKRTTVAGKFEGFSKAQVKTGFNCLKSKTYSISVERVAGIEPILMKNNSILFNNNILTACD